MMNETEDCFAVYTESEMRKCKAEWQKMCDELKAEIARRKRYCGFLLCCAKCGEIPKSYEWFCNKEKDD